MRITIAVTRYFVSLVLLLGCGLALAALPTSLNYQGHLTNDAGVPVDGAVNMSSLFKPNPLSSSVVLEIGAPKES